MSFNITFDYRFDTGFFDNADRRAALEEAGDIWEGLIGDEFPDVPAGVTFSIDDPSDDGTRHDITLEDPIDDLRIFVGAESLGGPLGRGGPAGFDAEGDVFDARVSPDFREGGPVTDFQPWAGTVSFDADADWNFDISAPQPGQSDFLSVALHEIGHVLGFGASGAFEALVNNGFFEGVNATEANGGDPVPLASGDDAHVEDGFRGDSVLMDPSLTTGDRTTPTDIDLAMLADIGYETDGFTAQGSTPPLATEGDDLIFGTVVTDRLDGLGGNDTIQGSDGDDILRGGPGNDVLWGEGGSDTFEIHSGDGGNRIPDFDLASEVITLVDSGFATLAEVTDAITKPEYFNVSRLSLPDGNTTVDITHEPQPGTPLTQDHFVLEQSAPTPPGPGEVALTGTLTTATGASLSDAPLVFTPSDGGAVTASTDAAGAFQLNVEEGATGRIDLADFSTGAADITAGDALEVLRIAVGLEPTFGAPAPENLIAADVTGDGGVTAGDALEVLRAAVGLPTDGPGAVRLPDPQDLAGLTADDVTYDTGVEVALNADTELSLSAVVLGDLGATQSV